MFVAIIIRLVDIMIISQGNRMENDQSQRLKAEEIHGRSVNIFDRKGKEIANNLDVESLYYNPENAAFDVNSARIFLLCSK